VKLSLPGNKLVLFSVPTDRQLTSLHAIFHCYTS